MTSRTVVYKLSADIASFRASMAQASASVRQTATEMTALDKRGATMRQGITTLGSAAGKFGLVAAAGLGAAVLKAANFDQAMSHVQAATQESAANMELLRDAAVKAGQDTVFSATEAAEGIENLAKAGVSTADILGGGLAGALDLAAAGGISVSEAAETAARAMTQFGLSGSDVPHVADLLAAAAGHASGEVGDFGMALSQSGLVANQVGASIEETTGALAAFAAAGLQGSDAGTSLKATFGALTPNSAKAAEAMDKLGISAFDAGGNFVGMAELAGNLRSSLKGMSDEQRQAALETIFGSDAVRAASVLYDEGEKGIRKWTAAVDDQGFAARQAGERLDNLKGDLEQLGGSLETALIGTGEGTQTPLRKLVQGLTGVTNAYNDLSPAAQGATAAVLGITAVTGGGLWFGSKVISGIASTKDALGQLGVQAGTTRTALSLVGKGIAVAAAIEGIGLLDSALDDLLNADFEGSNLQRSLTALSSGVVTGAIADTWDADLSKFNHDLDILDSNLDKITNAPISILPGSLSQLEGARDRFQQIDEALAGMVEGGHAKQAQQVFDVLAAKAHEGGNSTDQLRGALEQYELALDNAGRGTTWLSGLLGGLVPDFGSAGAAAEGAGRQVNSFKAELEDLNGVLDKRDAVRNYQAAMDDFRESFKGKFGFSLGTDEGRQNQALLDGIASSAANVASHLKGIARVDFVKNAIAQLREMADNMHLPQSEVDVLIAGLRTLNGTRAEPTVAPRGIPQAQSALEALIARMRALDGSSASPTVYIGGIAQSMADLYALQARINSMHGTTITNTVRTIGGPQGGPMADGGTVGGIRAPYGDKIHAFLAPGEEVISNRYGQADRHRDLLKAINAGRMADGGTVAQRVSVAPQSVQVQADFAPASVELRTPWGTQTVELIARRAARSEMSRERAYQDGLDDRG